MAMTAQDLAQSLDCSLDQVEAAIERLKARGLIAESGDGNATEAIPGLSFQASKGQWKAQHKGQMITYNIARYGEVAKELAYRALERMRAGTFDPVSDDILFKHSWRMADAAKQLGMTLGQLRQWILTGMVNGVEIRPPQRDVRGVDRITGHELMMAQERLADQAERK